MVFECSLNEILFSKVFPSKLFHLFSYYMLFCCKLLIINITCVVHDNTTYPTTSGYYNCQAKDRAVSSLSYTHK